MIKRFLFLILFLSFCTNLLPQDNGNGQKVQLYRNDAKGDLQYLREGTMDGNQVRTLFNNAGEVGHWPYQPSGEWPKGTGQSYLDGVCVLIASEVTAPGPPAKKIHPLETYYREWVDKDPETGKLWTLAPVPGYSNASIEKPAINTDKRSWPTFWPDALDLTSEWNSYWYGYFGRGVTNADVETFFVMDDSKDGEFARVPFNYFPIASDLERKGLGLRVETRGFQWSHVLAEDIIFWHYDIVNISDNDLDTTAFGFYTDPGVGGTNDSGDDCASFDTKLDIAYAFDGDGLGTPIRYKTGYYGYAYLESPGNSFDGIDNDEDGMIDERRDDGIDNDGDWLSFLDLNGNGVWDKEESEPLNNDVGKDGVGPFDPQYLGPDEGEGDGIPTDGEPNFDKTDKDESDQIGLTAVSLYTLGDGGVGGGWPKDDETMWLKMVAGTFDTSIQRRNISMVFASGPFPLKQGRRERFSMALVFGDDLDDIIFNKETVQQIYNANYNFSKPPYKPTLTAVPSDEKVFLFWDRIAEESRDPFLGFQPGPDGVPDPRLGYKKDFEGYLVYRSQEAEFNDIKVITDSKGATKYWKPIAQFDVKDGIKGPDPVGINGAHFWRGEDNGLAHSYIDTDVKNGQKYYYALVAYDQGDPNYGTTGLQPSETTKIITEDFSGNLQFIDINCAIATPNKPVAGYIPPSLVGKLDEVEQGIGTGSMQLEILDPLQVQLGAVYQVRFISTGEMPDYLTSSFEIVKIQGGIADTLVRDLDTNNIGSGKYSPAFDGMTISVINNGIGLLPEKSGWVVGNSNVEIYATSDTTNRALPWPSDYQIEFYDTVQDTGFIAAANLKFKKMPVNFKVVNLNTGKKNKIALKDNDNNDTFTPGDEIQILEFTTPQQTVNLSKIAWIVYYNPAPLGNTNEPVNGDKYLLKTSKPFYNGDYFSFSVTPPAVDNTLAKNSLGKINVVPNPYLGANSWERRNLNFTGRGERRIDFINLPENCTIRIYTMSGALVKTMRRGNASQNDAANLDKIGSVLDGTLSWNLVTEDGMDISYGVYIYHVDAPGIGEHIGKFAVIK